MPDELAERHRPRSWHEVADRLAARLAHHARYECGHEAAPTPDECPYCADVAAYEAWKRYSMPAPIDTEPVGRPGQPQGDHHWPEASLSDG